MNSALMKCSAVADKKRISETRAIAALLVRDIKHLSLTALRQKLNRGQSELSQAASRLDKKIEIQQAAGLQSRHSQKLASPIPISHDDLIFHVFNTHIGANGMTAEQGTEWRLYPGSGIEKATRSGLTVLLRTKYSCSIRFGIAY